MASSNQGGASRAMEWMGRQAISAAQSVEAPRASNAYNPKPAGVMIEGSTTHKVYQLLQDNPRRSFRYADLLRITGSTDNALNWACRWLVFYGHAVRRLDALSARQRYRYQLRTPGGK